MKQKNHFLCPDCCKDIYLKNYVLKNSTIKKKCTICLKLRQTVNISNDNHIIEFSRFLIRYHFPEYEYNPHWGGDDLPEQFYSENPIISHLYAERIEKDILIEEFLYELFDLSNFDSKIELYYGHDNTGRGLFPYAIKVEKSQTWKEYKSELRKKNFFLLEKKAKSKFSKILDDLTFNLSSSSKYFRARIGYKEKNQEIGISAVNIKIPYSDSEISSPPILKTKAGRANRQGVAFLYLASDKETSIGEIRPHPGHYVSIGKFISNKELRLADLRYIDLYKYYGDNKKLELFKLLKDLSDELSLPILPEEQEYYLVTQFISDIIRQLGFDGILFNSSVSSGYNLVVFDKGNFDYTGNSSELIKITSISFQYKKTEYHIDSFLERAIEK